VGATAAGYLPAPGKSDISEKIDVFVREWCIFFISGFPAPVREVTFSDFSLGFPARVVPVRAAQQ